jgi:CheY-like chemotaxis protein
LAECGADVTTAKSADDALAQLGAEHPDVLVSDIGMPDVDGYELLHRARRSAAGGAIPAVALTAFARSEDRTRAMRAGYIAHVAKPVEPAELLATIAVVTGRSSST